MGELWTAILVMILIVNLVAFFQIVLDKRRSIRKQFRIPEIRLAAPVLLYGIFGLVAGMVIMRHKTRKRSFKLKVVGCFVANAILTMILAGLFKI